MIMKQLGCVIAVVLCGFAAVGQVTHAPATVTNEPSMFKSPEDGWFDVSGFLDEKYGFLPIAMPITEPAVGYGVGGGLTFLSSPLGKAEAGYGRPSISAVGGFGTENGSWGVFAGDIRYWLDDRLQTVAAFMYGSVNLDFYGVGDDPALAGKSLSYNLEPVGGILQTKYRIGGSRVWAGLSYAFASTEVSFDAPPGTPGVPSFSSESNVGGVTPSVTYDSRDTIFTPMRGTYVEAQAGLFSEALGSDDEFQRAQVIAMQFLPLSDRLFLGLRGQVGTSFGDTPFYLRPYINLRGAPALRYQGDDMAQIEAELRWQFWKRFSAVGFVGTGAAWNDFEDFDDSQAIVTGGTGFRYEIARKYGLHMGLDVAFGPDNTAIYIQVGSAWMRP
jgi:outer membrane protein assembly factor BamA